ncbi:hypothetical protein RRG08_014655 [Elysia crispata]|uniref:Uncharacterized protein n=1 Tax=Elysia crispata TaxID=231223 RepID=A0AAE0YI62_9GAST|nr:hypothetical protein RRG08_014655 [Elysia crispata]
MGENKEKEYGREQGEGIWARTRRRNMGENKEKEYGREQGEGIWARTRRRNMGENKEKEYGREQDGWARGNRAQIEVLAGPPSRGRRFSSKIEERMSALSQHTTSALQGEDKKGKKTYLPYQLTFLPTSLVK